MDYIILQKAADNVHKNSKKIGFNLAKKYEKWNKEYEEVTRKKRLLGNSSLKKPCTL